MKSTTRITAPKKTWQVLIEPGVMKCVPIAVACSCGFMAGIIMLLVLEFNWPTHPPQSRVPNILLIVSVNLSVFLIVLLLLRVWFSAINKRHIDACELEYERVLWEQTLDDATRVQLEYARAGRKPPAVLPNPGWRNPDEPGYS
jgi:hypothetical protein